MSEPEWISWGPDSPGYPECPVAPGTDCEVRFAGGSTTRATMPESFEWWHESSCGDIAHYRVWPAKDDARAAEQVQLADATAGHFIEDDARAEHIIDCLRNQLMGTDEASDQWTFAGMADAVFRWPVVERELRHVLACINLERNR